VTTIEVTQADIDAGKPIDTCCPIALATTRATGATAVVTRKRVTLLGNAVAGRPALSAPLPDEASRFIRVFDTCGPAGVAPFTFDIDLGGAP
jgi:hypothetical protein